VVDYKLASSGMSQNMIISNYHKLRPTDVLKFVCGNIDDALESVRVLHNLSHIHTCKPIVYYHTIGGEPTQWMAKFILDRPDNIWQRFEVRMGVQLHRLLWGNARGV